MTTQNTLTLKTIAQCLAADVDFFVIGDVVYEDTEEENKEACQEWLDHNAFDYSDNLFQEWLDAEASVIDYDEDGDYIALTEEEADDKAKECILDSLWAFNSNFLSYETGFDECIFQALADNGHCENNNDAIYKLIEAGDNGIDDFVATAISADGRGHFLNTYDGNEEEMNMKEYCGENLYIFTYRMN